MVVTRILTQDLYSDTLMLPEYHCYRPHIQRVRDHMKEVIDRARERKKIPTFHHIPWSSIKDLDLSFMDLRGADFSGLDLSSVFCVGTYFNYAILNRTDFTGSIFRCCNFLFAQCRGTNFLDCHMRLIEHNNNLPLPKYRIIYVD